ncbi:MAG: histidine phosphotransferase family protein [Pseudomonadota bacterium]
MSAQRDIAALLGSRICHDLISPLGAIGNGIELLGMSPEGASAEVALIAESVENANARIRYFRVAFGAASPEASLGRAEVAEILRDLTKSGRIGIEWDAAGAMPRREVKLAFLLILCLETAMPWGGQIHVSSADGAWYMGATAEKFKIDASLWELLVSPRADLDITAAQVQFALVPEMARNAGRTVTTDIRESYIKISF